MSNVLDYMRADLSRLTESLAHLTESEALRDVTRDLKELRLEAERMREENRRLEARFHRMLAYFQRATGKDTSHFAMLDSETWDGHDNKFVTSISCTPKEEVDADFVKRAGMTPQEFLTKWYAKELPDNGHNSLLSVEASFLAGE